MAKSVFVAYFLWVIGGIFGLHLFYLRRDAQMFIWWCTFGGYCGLGILRDFLRIPTYVKDINEDVTYMAKLTSSMQKNKMPPIHLTRIVGQLLVGSSWTYLLASAIPKEEIYGIDLQFLQYFTPLISSLAVWIIGNIGREKGDFKWAFLGSAVLCPVSFYFPRYSHLPIYGSTLLFNYHKKWRRTPRKRYGLCSRIFALTFCGLVFLSIWGSYLYFNAEITDKHNVKIKLRDAVKNFYNSPIVQEYRKNLWLIYEEGKTNGFGPAYEKLIELLDPHGEIHSLKVLGLTRGATQSEISSTYKKLVREWHPDKHHNKGKQEQEEINNRFMEIQKAYEKLSAIKSKRKKKNT